MKLEGIRVIDLSQFLPGPYLTLMMADHGAEVIKVEPPGAGEPNRNIGPREGSHSVFFRNTHRGKKSVVLNLKAKTGQEALLKLAQTAAVFVESFRPGVVDRLGVGYEEVSAVKPDIIYCSLSAFGQTGPYRDRPAHDLAVEALAGFVSLNEGSDGAPVMPAVPASDFAAALSGLNGVLMALYRRTQTGRGEYIDIAMHDSVLSWTTNVLGPILAENRELTPKHERTLGGAAFYNIYETRDGRHVVLGAQEPKFVHNLLNELGRQDLVPLCEQGPGPHQQPVRDYLQSVFKDKTRQEWVDWFADKDVTFAPVNSLREAVSEPQVEAREMILRDADGFRNLGNPIKFTDEPAQYDFRAPELGEHTVDLLRDVGYSDEDLSRMRAEGVIPGIESD